MKLILNGDALILVQIYESYFSGLRKNGHALLIRGDFNQNDDSGSREDQ